MRVQIERCEQAFNEDGTPDGYDGGHGWTDAYKVDGYVLDDVPAHKIRAGDYGFFKGNFKKIPVQGATEDFEIKLKKGTNQKISFPDGTTPDGNKLWRVVIERPKQGGGSGHGGQRPNPAPASPQRAANAPQAHSRVVPPMSQAVAVFVDCATAIAAARAELPECDRDLLGPGQVTTLFLARMDGRIVRNPTAADIAAQQAEADRKATEAAAEAQRLADEAAERARAVAQRIPQAPVGYAPSVNPPDDDIPF